MSREKYKSSYHLVSLLFLIDGLLETHIFVACFESHPANTSDGFNLDLLVFSPFEDELSQKRRAPCQICRICTWRVWKNLQGDAGNIESTLINDILLVLGWLLNLLQLLTYYQFEKVALHEIASVELGLPLHGSIQNAMTCHAGIAYLALKTV